MGSTGKITQVLSVRRGVHSLADRLTTTFACPASKPGQAHRQTHPRCSDSPGDLSDYGAANHVGPGQPDQTHTKGRVLID